MGCTALACRGRTVSLAAPPPVPGHGQGRGNSEAGPVGPSCPPLASLSQTALPYRAPVHAATVRPPPLLTGRGARLPNCSAQAEVSEGGPPRRVLPRNHLFLAHRWANSVAGRTPGLLSSSPVACGPWPAACFSALGSERQPIGSAHSGGRPRGVGGLGKRGTRGRGRAEKLAEGEAAHSPRGQRDVLVRDEPPGARALAPPPVARGPLEQPQHIPALEAQLLGRAARVGEASHGLHGPLQVWGEKGGSELGGGAGGRPGGRALLVSRLPRSPSSGAGVPASSSGSFSPARPSSWASLRSEGGV